MSLSPLSRYQPPRYRPKVPVIVALLTVALLDVASIFLNWVGVITDAGSYVVANGFEQASWVLVVAVVVIALAVRLIVGPPTAFVRCVFVGLDFLVSLGLYIEYVNNLGRAESYTTPPYLGRDSFSRSVPRRFSSQRPSSGGASVTIGRRRSRSTGLARESEVVACVDECMIEGDDGPRAMRSTTTALILAIAAAGVAGYLISRPQGPRGSALPILYPGADAERSIFDRRL